MYYIKSWKLNKFRHEKVARWMAIYCFQHMQQHQERKHHVIKASDGECSNWTSSKWLRVYLLSLFTHSLVNKQLYIYKVWVIQMIAYKQSFLPGSYTPWCTLSVLFQIYQLNPYIGFWLRNIFWCDRFKTNILFPLWSNN